jgi:hypothetical protein
VCESLKMGAKWNGHRKPAAARAVPLTRLLASAASPLPMPLLESWLPPAAAAAAAAPPPPQLSEGQPGTQAGGALTLQAGCKGAAVLPLRRERAGELPAAGRRGGQQ